MTVSCPDCHEEISVPEETEVGEILECENCGAEMEVISLEPIKVKLIEEEK
jgi:alpha-aminoadipate carrier protein LysW